MDLILSPVSKAALFGEATALDAPGKTDSTAWVRGLLAAAAGPLTFRDIIAAAAGTEFEERIRRNANVIYNAVTRLADRDEVKRVGKAIVPIAVYKEIVAQGRDPEAVFGEDEEANGPEIVRALLSSHPQGLSTKEMITLMRTHEAFGPKLQRNPQYGYTLLSRMTKRGQLTRNAQHYLTLPGASIEEGPSDEDRDPRD